MSRLSYLLPLLFALSAVTRCAAGHPTNKFQLILKGYPARYVCIAEGEPIVGRGGPSSSWYIDGTRIKNGSGGGYLAYDPTGKDDKVFLVSRPEEAFLWQVKVPNERREEELGDIRADAGPRKGWYLCEVEGRLVLRKKPSGKVQAKRIFE